MKTQIHLKSAGDLELFHSKIRMARMQFPDFQEKIMQQLADDIVLTEIHNRMRQNDFSPKIIEGTTVDRVQSISSGFRVWFRSELFSPSGFDIAVARERGTPDHFIAPVNSKVLRWVEEDGTVRYSTGHQVSGMPALLIIADTIRRFSAQLLSGFNNRVQNWLDMNFGGFV